MFNIRPRQLKITGTILEEPLCKAYWNEWYKRPFLSVSFWRTFFRETPNSPAFAWRSCRLIHFFSSLYCSSAIFCTHLTTNHSPQGRPLLCKWEVTHSILALNTEVGALPCCNTEAIWMVWAPKQWWSLPVFLLVKEEWGAHSDHQKSCAKDHETHMDKSYMEQGL